MRRIHLSLLVSVLLVLGAQPLFAATYYVGSCKTGSYSTVQAAVSGVPSGSTIEVCPGTYYEQVVISKALTLEAIPNAGGLVTISDNGLTLATTTSIYWGTVAPHIQITAGPVNITGIALYQYDGEGPDSGCTAFEIGIFYGSGSSGTVKGVNASSGTCYFYNNQRFSSIGIAAENGAGVTQSVTIEDSYIVSNNNGWGVNVAGISIYSGQTPPSLNAKVRNNYVTNQFSELGGGPSTGMMYLGTAQGSIIGNFIITSYVNGQFDGTPIGVLVESPNAAVSENWIYEQNVGINIETAGANVTSNQMFNNTTGILIGIGGATVKSNTIFGSQPAIDFSCTTGNTVAGNTINTFAGLGNVPTGFTGSNTFYNVSAKNPGGCA
jgi:Periplasmic copper-binding protein (NosD)